MKRERCPQEPEALCGPRTSWANARPALVGLTASHTRAHVIRAILEGVTFSLRDTFEIFRELNVPIKTIRLGGGGARSSLWRQIQADVYGRQVELVQAASTLGQLPPPTPASSAAP